MTASATHTPDSPGPDPLGEADPVVNPDRRIVTVWSDTSCPWAALALATVHTAAHERGSPLLVDHRAFPLELFNRAPTPKFIVDAEIVAIAGHRPELGWRLWTGRDCEFPVTMLPAMEAVQAAKDPAVGGLPASDELDAALRRAFLAEGRCISIHPVILDIAERCEHVDAGALAAALARGDGRRQVYEQWRVAQGPRVQGSCHLFTAAGYAEHNPGVTYHWTARPGEGFPRLEHYTPGWADHLLDLLTGP